MAEVLITLGIIGVVAALTLPNLMSNYQEKQTVTRLKNTYSILSEAIRLTIMEHGNLDDWADDSVEFFRQELTKHLKVIKTCSTYSEYVSCSGMDWQDPPAYVLSNGVVIRFSRYPNDPGASIHCSGSLANGGYYNKCSVITVDINGRGKPNMNAKDIFTFFVYPNGVIPAGAVSRLGTSWIDTFDEACMTGSPASDNSSCSAWVIYHENMDYLKCRDKLSWDGPYSCKEAEENK